MWMQYDADVIMKFGVPQLFYLIFNDLNWGGLKEKKMI